MAVPTIELQRRRDRPTRQLIDGAGRRWSVFEVVVRTRAHDVPPELSLVADDEGIVRRFREFPETWHEMTDAQLDAFINAPVPRPRRPAS